MPPVMFNLLCRVSVLLFCRPDFVSSQDDSVSADGADGGQNLHSVLEESEVLKLLRDQVSYC